VAATAGRSRGWKAACLGRRLPAARCTQPACWAAPQGSPAGRRLPARWPRTEASRSHPTLPRCWGGRCPPAAPPRPRRKSAPGSRATPGRRARPAAAAAAARLAAPSRPGAALRSPHGLGPWRAGSRRRCCAGPEGARRARRPCRARRKGCGWLSKGRGGGALCTRGRIMAHQGLSLHLASSPGRANPCGCGAVPLPANDAGARGLPPTPRRRRLEARAPTRPLPLPGASALPLIVAQGCQGCEE
jgi:hypothetical protein